MKYRRVYFSPRITRYDGTPAMIRGCKSSSNRALPSSPSEIGGERSGLDKEGSREAWRGMVCSVNARHVDPPAKYYLVVAGDESI